MNKSGHTRRHLLKLGAVGLTTSIAGCQDQQQPPPDDYEDNPPDEDTDPDDDTNNVPDPGMYFHAPNETFPLSMLPRTPDSHPVPGDMSIQHRDNTLFTIEVHDENNATATLEKTNVKRDIELRLHVRDTDHNWKTATAPLKATETDSPETHEVEFDISNVNLPTGAGSICELVAVDHEFDSDYEFIIKRHQFVGVPHKNGVSWVNAENLNHTYRADGGGSRTSKSPVGVTGDVNHGHMTESPAGYIEHHENDDERTVIFVTRTPYNGELFGVSAHIKHEPVNNYKNGSERYRYRYGHHHEAYFATEISHFRELATKTHDVISRIGGDTKPARLAILGDMIQMIPYLGQGQDPPPTIVAYEALGDCSSKSILMSAILQNDPWNVMPAYIDCEVNGVGHWTIGLDVDDLQGMSGIPDMFTVSPTDSQVERGFTDTEWAFFDMTFSSEIGDRTEGVENPVVYDEGDFSKRDDHRFNDNNPPDY